MSLMASESFTLASSAELVVVPLFILMGNVATETGMSRKLYDAAYADDRLDPRRDWLRLPSSVVAALPRFPGSSVASALTMGKVSLGRNGTLQIRCPPVDGRGCGWRNAGYPDPRRRPDSSSTRSWRRNRSDGSSWRAFLPGLLLLAMFVLTVSILCWFFPNMGPAGTEDLDAGKSARHSGRDANPDRHRADYRRHLWRAVLAGRGCGGRSRAGYHLRLRRPDTDDYEAVERHARILSSRRQR